LIFQLSFSVPEDEGNAARGLNIGYGPLVAVFLALDRLDPIGDGRLCRTIALARERVGRAE
jgi:hypothetical protein